MEAWVYVNIDEQPPVPIDAYETSGDRNEKSKLYNEQYKHINDPEMFPFYGFGRIKGVLTWFNSD